jgi:hypothetical protein
MKRESAILYRRRQVDWAQHDVFRRNGGHGFEFFLAAAIPRAVFTAPDARHVDLTQARTEKVMLLPAATALLAEISAPRSEVASWLVTGHPCRGIPNFQC